VRVLPAALIASGVVMVLAAGAIATGFFAFEPGGLDQPGARIAAPFEQIHAAQREQIRAAMSAPLVLGVPRKKLERIAECESHGDPRAKSAGGLYRGKYQFDRGTWASVGGEGDPARASELEQDRRAAALLKRSGSSPWPVCG
jgi:hypothetical protein